MVDLLWSGFIADVVKASHAGCGASTRVEVPADDSAEDQKGLIVS